MPEERPMNIAHSMWFVIQRARSLREILDNAVELIASAMGTDVCSIYLLDPRDHRLRLMATKGLDKAALGKVTLALGEGLTGRVVKEMRHLAVEDASSHPGYLYFPETKEEQFQSYLGVPLAIQRRPVGAIVVQTRDRRPYTADEIQTLSAISAQLVGVVENARLIDALDRGEEGNRYLREVRSWRSLGRVAPSEAQEDVRLSGTPASPGIAIGAAIFRGSYEIAMDAPTPAWTPETPAARQGGTSSSDGGAGPAHLASIGPETELRRVEEAFEKTQKEILKIQEAAEREAGEEHATIFSSHLLLLNDDVLHEKIRESVRAGHSASQAIFEALEHFSKKLQGVPDPYIQDRVEDISDLRSRLLGQLVPSKAKSPAMSDKIVVARGIPPSLVVEIKAEGAKGIITERGGPTSHGALLARSMGIPAVTGIVDIVLLVRSGDTIILDGGSGEVIVAPTRATLDAYEGKVAAMRSRHESNLRFRHVPAKTKDGVRVPLLANVGVATDIFQAYDNGAEGIGLYRTEFPFIIREDLPSVDDQVHIYRKAYEYFPNGPVVFRLLDLGGDKFLPNNRLDPDRNPFRGFRSIRVLLENPEILRGQVQAFAHAAGARPFSILIPMVSSLPELRKALGHIRDVLSAVRDSGRQLSVAIGAMIEVPAAVELAREMALEVDYFSIGSNDLTQYTLAVDRDNPRAGSPFDSYHPAVLRLIRRTIEAGHSRGKPVSVCGEIAGNPKLALLLVAMGVDSLSVAPGAIPELKRILSAAEVGRLKADVDRILALGDATEIEASLRGHLPSDGGSQPPATGRP